jgi:hypothetical protein
LTGKNHKVDSDYVEVDDWRTKTSAVSAAQLEGMRGDTDCDHGEKKHRWMGNAPVVDEKKSMIIFFHFIELKIYEEMAKGE